MIRKALPHQTIISCLSLIEKCYCENKLFIQHHSKLSFVSYLTGHTIFFFFLFFSFFFLGHTLASFKREKLPTQYLFPFPIILTSTLLKGIQRHCKYTNKNRILETFQRTVQLLFLLGISIQKLHIARHSNCLGIAEER